MASEKELKAQILEEFGIRVRTVFDFPPIPFRGFDWAAFSEDDPESFVGQGETEEAALRDFIEQMGD